MRVAGLLDTLLDRAIVPGYSRIGYARGGTGGTPTCRPRRSTAAPSRSPGANSGLGLATAIGAARLGAAVRLLCRDARAGRAGAGRDPGGRARRASVPSTSATSARSSPSISAASRLRNRAAGAARARAQRRRAAARAHRDRGRPRADRRDPRARAAPADLRAAAAARRRHRRARRVRVLRRHVHAAAAHRRPGVPARRVRRHGGLRPHEAHAGRAGAAVGASASPARAWPCTPCIPGWASTPGITDSLPRFARVVGPILRNADEGADTAVWLLGAPAAGSQHGLFWHDRRPRPTSYLPFTRHTDRTPSGSGTTAPCPPASDADPGVWPSGSAACTSVTRGFP